MERVRLPPAAITEGHDGLNPKQFPDAVEVRPS